MMQIKLTGHSPTNYNPWLKLLDGGVTKLIDHSILAFEGHHPINTIRF